MASATRIEPETMSASVNLEDIIQDYDDASIKSKSISLASLSHNQQQSQTYFSATEGNKDLETTSFYTALQDDSSLNRYNDDILRDSPEACQDLLWTSDDGKEREAPQPDFQVFWSNLTYRIEPKITIGNIWGEFEQRCKNAISSTHKLLNCNQNDINQGFSNDSSPLCKKEPLTIIQQISGSFKSGELTAVMGPSGAGKTSLLNFLSRRREEGYTGELYVDNSHRRIKISTIPHNDQLPEYLSVEENLMFASRLKNPFPNYDHAKNIEKVSSLLGLDDCLDTRTKKISGGQHKRLSIAQELLSKPDILILDEPTSGLDSLTCYKTISVLKNLVKSSARKLIDPIAIVVTIHQPQQEVFDIFDKVYVMATSGIAIYDGTPDRCTQFIHKHSGIQMPSNDYNPASFLIEIASGEYGTEPIKALENRIKLEFKMNRKEFKLQNFSKKPNDINDKSKQSLSRKSSLDSNENIEEIQLSNKSRIKPLLYIDQRIAKGSSMNRGNFWLKTRILSERYSISIFRDPKQLIARIIFHIFLPICLALMMGTEPGQSNACPNYQNQYELKDLMQDIDQKSKLQQSELILSLENIALIFVLIYALSSANIAAVTLSFTLDMQSSLKEFHNGWYSMYSYITARFITDIPVEVCLPILALALGYPLTGQMTGHGLADGYRIMITSLAMILGSLVGQAIGMIFGAIYIGYVSTALFASQGATLPLVFLSGFVVRTTKMSNFVSTLSRLSFYRYILEVTIIARYGFNVCDCDPKTITGQEATLVGVPDKLRSFTQVWLGTLAESDQEVSTNSTSDSNSDLFQIIAKQISLFNTNGVEVRSCKDVTPYQLNHLSLTESDLPSSFLGLIILLILIRLLLLLTVKLVIHFRTSL